MNPKTKKRFGIGFIIFSVIYTVVELLDGEAFNFFVPIALISTGVIFITNKDGKQKRNENSTM